MEEVKPKGEGVIHVSVEMWHELGEPKTIEEWRKVLLLSDAWQITGIVPPEMLFYGEYSVLRTRNYTLQICHEAIPQVVGSNVLPVVYPYYRREPILDRIEVHVDDHIFYIDAEHSHRIIKEDM